VTSTEPTPSPTTTSKRPTSAAAVLGALIIGAIIGGMAVEYWMTRATPKPSAQTMAPASADLTADVTRLKNVVPTQSHTMQDVGFHWASLWFAAEKKNWPLALYYFTEARQAIRWTILIRPVRQLPTGGTVDVKGIFAGLDPSVFAMVQIAIEDKDSAAFTTSYRQALDACHSCHTAAGLPFLRPVVPTSPPSTLMSLDPAAK
jgi:hypothetical protein